MQPDDFIFTLDLEEARLVLRALKEFPEDNETLTVLIYALEQEISDADGSY